MADFEITPLSEKRKRSISSRISWPDDAPVSLDQIVSVHFLHDTFNDGINKGQIHILDVVAEHALDIFRKLFVIQFPIQSAIPIDEFDGDDVRSMQANNSSAFNPRKIMNTDRWSSHAYGCAIDINPLQNPYVLSPGSNEEKIYPEGGAEYTFRKDLKAGMVEGVVDIFKSHGFDDWGGDWESPLDYHHFQVKSEKIHRLAKI